METLTTATKWFGPTAPCGSGGIKKKPPLLVPFWSKLMPSMVEFKAGAPGVVVSGGLIEVPCSGAGGSPLGGIGALAGGPMGCVGSTDKPEGADPFEGTGAVAGGPIGSGGSPDISEGVGD